MPIRHCASPAATTAGPRSTRFSRPTTRRSPSSSWAARRPGDAWHGTLISADGVHPSSAAAQGPATPENLAKCGYLLRNWLNVHKVMEIKAKVLDGAVGGVKAAPARPAATR